MPTTTQPFAELSTRFIRNLMHNTPDASSPCDKCKRTGWVFTDHTHVMRPSWCNECLQEVLDARYASDPNAARVAAERVWPLISGGAE